MNQAKIFTSLFIILSSLSAFAFKVAPNINPLALKNIGNKEIYEGIVKLTNCSGSLVIFKDAPMDNKALIMTNGHCIKDLRDSSEISITNIPYQDKVGVFNRKGKLKKLKITKIVYATTTGTDVSFLETNLSYDSIKNLYDIEPFILNDQLSPLYTPINIISGYWEMITGCEIQAIAPILKEGKYLWKESIRYSKECMTQGGFSGSPVIEKNTRTVLGIHNTGNNGLLDCSIMNPCELNLNGELIFSVPNRRYAQQIFQFYDCLNSNFKIDLKVHGCEVK